MKFLIRSILILFLSSPLIYAEVTLKLEEDKIILEYENDVYAFPSTQKDEYEGIQKVLQEDIDGDGEKEYIIGVQLRHAKAEVPISSVIIANQQGDVLEIQHQIHNADYFIDMEAFDVTKDGVMDLIIEGQSGMHFHELTIISWQDDKYVAFWDKGSACGVYFEVNEKGNAQVKVGIPLLEKEGWCYADEPDWEIWMWNGKKFEYI